MQNNSVISDVGGGELNPRANAVLSRIEFIQYSREILLHKLLLLASTMDFFDESPELTVSLTNLQQSLVVEPIDPKVAYLGRLSDRKRI